MWRELVILLLIVSLIGLTVLWYTSTETDVTDGIPLLIGSRSGLTEDTRSYVTPRSFNQPEGAVFTYTTWVLVNDFTLGFNTLRRIFSKGDCPGLYINESNSLLVKVDTFGNVQNIVIPNIPASKWLHIAIVVDQRSVDVYVNGILRKHQELTQLPEQNNANVITGPGWDGVIGNLVYYTRALSTSEIQLLASKAPPDDLRTKVGSGNYFDKSWYMGRLNSS